MSHLTSVKLQLKNYETLTQALDNLNFEYNSHTQNVIHLLMKEENKKNKTVAITFNKKDDHYIASYDEWFIHNYGATEYWKNLDVDKLLSEINKEYTRQLVLQEAEKMVPEYGEYFLEEVNEGQFKLTFPQMQTASVGV